MPTVQTPGGAVVGPLAGRGRHEGEPGRQQVGRPCTPVAASGPLLVSVTVKVMMSPTLGVALLTVLVDRQVGLLRRLGGAGAVVARVRVELVGVG